MKYKIGDRVRVRENLTVGEYYDNRSFTKDMSKLSGEVVTIDVVNAQTYKIKEDGVEWYWTDSMFMDIDDEEIDIKKSTKKEKTVDVGYYLKFCGHRVIENVYQCGIDEQGDYGFESIDGMNKYLLPREAIKWVIPHEG